VLAHGEVDMLWSRGCAAVLRRTVVMQGRGRWGGGQSGGERRDGVGAGVWAWA
jgi:hypothetical protein